jgi:hypothetical protein
MVRTGLGDQCVGYFGGRLFMIDWRLSNTIEYLDTTVETALSVQDYLDLLGVATMSTIVPGPDGNFRMVSRAGGMHHVRSDGAGNSCSVWAGERGPRVSLQCAFSFISTVRVRYQDAVDGTGEEMDVATPYSGGVPLDLDLTQMASGASSARAIGSAVANWYGYPAKVITETWVDQTLGDEASMPPCFWADWQVSDVVSLDPYTGAAPAIAYKIIGFTRGDEKRQVQAQLMAFPTVPMTNQVVSIVNVPQQG